MNAAARLALAIALSLTGCGAEVVEVQSGGASDTGSTGTAGDACAAITCAAPPGPSCASATTLRSHDAMGTCSMGVCSYGYSDSVCPAGCSEGSCKPGFHGARIVSGRHSCAVTAQGALKCWGDNERGQLGDGTTTERLVPTQVASLSSNVVSVARGYSHTCAATTAGGLACWGDNFAGQLGLGSTAASLVPKGVISASAGIVATAGAFQTCALAASGALTCWGSNNFGQVGDGTTMDRLAPVPVVGLSTDVFALGASYLHSCAIRTSGKVACWGFNDSGELGNGSKSESHVPVEVVDLSSAVAVAGGDNHTCALTASGTVKCWGWNDYGQLGDGTKKNRTKPVEVLGLGEAAVAVAAGSLHTCALSASGGVKCWGWNLGGQLGDGTTTDSLSPVEVVGLSSGVVALAVGGSTNCAMSASGGLKCWGGNEYGQIGDGTKINRSTPVEVVGF